MKTTLAIFVIVCVILTACSELNDHLTAFPVFTQEPGITAAITKTPTPTRLPPTEPPPTSTITPFPPYENKRVIFRYYLIGNHSVYDMFFDDYSYSNTLLVLYEDGQLIIPGEVYKQNFLSRDEIKRFLSKLEAMRFYTLESNQKHDPSDKLYDYGTSYQRSYDGLKYCISVNAEISRTLCAYEPDMQFLIPRMKNILEYWDAYKPGGMIPYLPDRILLWAEAGREPGNENLTDTAIPWHENFPSLENSISFVDGGMAKEIYLLLGNTNVGKVFVQNGKEYTVYMLVVLPHEKLINGQ